MEDHGWQRVGTARLGTASRGQWTAKRGLAGRGHSGTLHSGGEAKHSDGRVGTAQQGSAQPRLPDSATALQSMAKADHITELRWPSASTITSARLGHCDEQKRIARARKSEARHCGGYAQLCYASIGVAFRRRGNALLETAKAAIDEAMSAGRGLGAAAWTLRRCSAQRSAGMALKHSAPHRHSTGMPWHRFVWLWHVTARQRLCYDWLWLGAATTTQQPKDRTERQDQTKGQEP